MAEKIVSPGVFSKEIDASFLPAAVGDIGAVVVGPTVKGPALTPTVVSSYQEFQAKFGDVFKSGSGYYQYLTSHTAKNYLEHQGPLTVVRVMGASYSHASATVSSSIDPSVVGGGTFATGSFTFETNTLQSETASIGGVNFLFVSESISGSLGRGLLNTSTNIYVETGSTVTVTAAHFRDALNNSGSAAKGIAGLPLTASSVAGVVSITASIAGSTQFNLIGGSQISGTLTIDTSSNATTDWSSNTNIGGGNNYNNNTFLTPFKLHTLSHGTVLNNGANGEGSNNLLVDGTSNNVRWEISQLNKNKGTFTVVLRRGDDTHKKKLPLETWNNCTLDPNQPNYIAKVIGDQYITVGGTATDPFLQFNGDYPNKSSYVRVEVLKQTVDYLDENGNVRLGEASASLPTFYSGSNSGSSYGSFSGGDDGTVTHPIGDYLNENIGQITQGFDLNVEAQREQYLTALNLLANADEYDFNLLLIPGILRNQTGHASIISKAVDVCESRGDAFTVVDTVDYGTNSIIAVTDQAKALDSNYAATYWPWVQVPDTQTGKNVWAPPSVAVAGILAYNDKVGHPWFAPAGLNRGVITTAVQAKRKLTLGNRDQLYDSNVNPIATFPAEGVVVWGQKTLQKKSSALDRVNVRRLLIKVKKFLSASSRFLVFEQNDAKTRNTFLAIANPFLQSVKDKSGLNEFKVVMDTTNNTPDLVDRNILYGQIFVQPTKTAEFIILDFTIQPTGATFPE